MLHDHQIRLLGASEDSGNGHIGIAPLGWQDHGGDLDFRERLLEANPGLLLPEI